MLSDIAALLDRTEWPSWTDDAPLRRELLRLEEDMHSLRVAHHDPRRAARLTARCQERADRIRQFTNGRRHGTAYAT